MSSSSLMPYAPLPAPWTISLRLGQLERAAFDHDDRFARAGHRQIEIGEFELLEVGFRSRRLRPGRRARRQSGVPWHFGHRQRRGRRGQAEHVGVVFLVGRKHIDEDLHFVLKPSGKSGRTERSITRAEVISSNRRAAFALQKSRRDLAGGVGLLAYSTVSGK